MQDLRPGSVLATQTYRLTRADLVLYADASGDHNPIHWSDQVAATVGLPGVVAHGMLTMALGGRALTAWAGDPGRIRAYGARFTRPVVVPAGDEGVEVAVAGVVDEVADGLARVDITVTCAGTKVLGQAHASIAVDV